MSKKLTLGIFGFGVVGQGLYDIIRTNYLQIDVKKFVIRDGSKVRPLPAELFTTDRRQVLDDPEITTVVELIDDADAAFEIVSEALKKGKDVVSANKKMIAHHLEELVAIQKETGSSLLYEGAVCGSIPIIRNLEEYYDNELLYAVSGIFNGSSNYILSQICIEGWTYEKALKKAQDLGFAESDPSMDVGGFDPKFKLVILAAHSYGLFLAPEEVLNIGIHHLGEEDLQFATERGWKIKLVPEIRQIGPNEVTLYVLPRFVEPGHLLYNVEHENNAVLVKAAFANEQFFYGKGAGGHPTGSAVLSDITALRYGYKYEYKKHLHQAIPGVNLDVEIPVYLRYSDPELVEKVGFSAIEEYGTSPNSYVVGRISLRQILAAGQAIEQDRAFLAQLPDSASKLPDSASKLSDFGIVK